MFVSIRVESWEEAKAAFSVRPLWVFRGQADQSWLPETCLYRQGERVGARMNSLQNREEWMVRNFQRFAHHHLSSPPHEYAILDWLALIQHYGGPTRLLDFTWSFYIASFFAVETAATEAAVWAVDFSDLCAAAADVLAYENWGSIIDTKQANMDRLLLSIRMKSAESGIVPVEPWKMHERLWMQQGLFLVPTNPTKPFVQNLAETFRVSGPDFASEPISWSPEIDERTHLDLGEPDSISIVKLVLPREIHEDILSDLRNMNISAATLFPGLDGLARSLASLI